MRRRIRGTVGAAGGVIAALQVSAPAAALPTYKGAPVRNPFGSVQVTIRVSGARVIGLSATGPRHAAYSRTLTARSLPILRREALRAQSADINGVSGATYTSNGFERSLCKALLKAGLVSACGAPSTPLPGEQVSLVNLEGIVQSVNTAAGTLVLQVNRGNGSQGQQVTVQVNRQTRFGGYRSSFSQISPNDQVSVIVDESRRPFLAKNIFDYPPQPPSGPY